MTCEPTKSSALPGEPGTYEHTLARLVQMAGQPAWKAWAWGYAKELDKESSGYFRGIAQELKDAMTAKAQPSEGQHQEKHP